MLKPSAPGLEGVAHHRRHLRDFFRGRVGIVGRALAHHIGPHRAMGHMRADIDRALHPRQRVEIFAESLPFELDSGRQGFAGDVLNGVHQAYQVALLAAPHGREPHPAIAHHHGGHAVPARGRDIRIPSHLAVVMGMDVDPAGSRQQAVSVEFAPSGARLGAQFGDNAAINCDIAVARRCSGAVHDSCVADYQIMHRIGSPLNHKSGAGADESSAR